MSKLVVAAIQMDSGNNKKENLLKAEYLIKESVSKGAKFVALPEYFTFHGLEIEEGQIAEEIPNGETYSFLSNIAKEHNIWLCGGSILEKVQGSDKFYNTSLFFKPNGELIAKYRKIHLFEAYLEDMVLLESNTKNHGNEIVHAETSFGKVGMSICYDLRFPELFRILTLNGANMLVLPAAFTMQTGKDHWEALLRARAIENQVYVIAPAQIGKKAAYENYGHTLIIDPWGTVIASASDIETPVIAEIDLSYVEKVRRMVPALLNRKTDVYQVGLSKNNEN